MKFRNLLLAAFVSALSLPATVGAQPSGAAATNGAEAPFLAENDAAMKKMMRDMAAVKPTGDVDRDFVSMMVPHHQAAVAMAQSILRYGRNEELKRLAREIVDTQQQEITTMRRAVAAREFQR